MAEIRVTGLGPGHANQEFELVERKGCGHPDTLADALAEHLSRAYARYTLERYGAVLHHQFDKVGILGGAASLSFGHGRLVRPIRILLDGRATARFADDVIPVENLLVDTTRQFFAERYPMLDFDRDFRVIMEVSQSASPGAVEGGTGSRARWFHPRSLDDLPNHRDPRCNDTSSGCGYAPLTALERLVLASEESLAAGFRPERQEWLGTDIKIMAVRWRREARVTMAIPQIAAHVADVDAYREHIAWAVQRLAACYAQDFPELDVSLEVNTRDDYERGEFYLTHTGSSMEAGDEGLVGRGNRMGGLIASGRRYTMEGICGKNPVYHTGKMYCAAAWEMARDIAAATGSGTEVAIVGQSGRRLADPWAITVELATHPDAARELEPLVKDWINHHLDRLPEVTAKLLAGSYPLS